MKPFSQLLRLSSHSSQGMQDAGVLQERCSQTALEHLLPTNQPLNVGLTWACLSVCYSGFTGSSCLSTVRCYKYVHCFYLKFCLEGGLLYERITI